MDKAHGILLAAAEVSEKMKEIVVARELHGDEMAIIEALKAAYENIRHFGLEVAI